MKNNFNEFKKFIKNKNTAVVGVGVSNTPLIYKLLNLGAKVTAFDKKDKGALGDTAESLEEKGVKLVLGENYLDNLKGFDVIFKTPGMRIDSPALIYAKQEGAYITSEMKEFIKYCPAKIYGITGSDGKTTTTSLIYNMLKEEGHNTWVGGNIGVPLFEHIEDIGENDRVVLELSSFQLMTLDISPKIALVTNVTPNHLDIHKDMEEYVESKKNIYKFQNADNRLVLNKDNSITNAMAEEALGEVYYFSTKETIKQGAHFKEDILYVMGKEVCHRKDIILKGMHNVENLLAAFSSVYGDVSISNMKKVALNFKGVEHRCEFVRAVDGVEYYNDSIASSPTRTLAGLKSFEKPVVLIAGGYDKNIPFNVLAEEGTKCLKAVILLGATKYKIRDAFHQYFKNNNEKIPIFIVEDFREAVEKAREITEVGDIVTMAPACASFDMFKNFEYRGKAFKDIVNSL